MFSDFHTSRVIESLQEEGYKNILQDGKYLKAVKDNTQYIFSIVRKNYTNDSESTMTVIKDGHLNQLEKVGHEKGRVPVCIFSLWLKGKELSHVLTIPFAHIGEELQKVKHGYSLHFSDIEDCAKFQFTKCHHFTTDLIQSFHSWEVHSGGLAIKKTDKSTFLHHGTAIPKELYDFFNTSDMVEGDRKAVSLAHSSGTYSADFTVTNNRVRLFWKHDFTNLIQTTLPDVFSAYLEGSEPEVSPRFSFQSSKTDNSSFLIEFLEPEEPLKEKKQRNPRWTRDELILALDLYFKEPTAHGNASHHSVVELSNLLNALPLHKGRKLNEKYRNPNGVGMKLANFRTFDPEYEKGLSSSSRLDHEIWDEFSADKKRLNTIAVAIKSNYNDISSADELDDDDDTEATEGRILTRIHQKRERSAKLIKKKKQQVLKQTGKLECEVCGFDYEKVYGKRGNGFAECHHTKPVSKLGEGEKTKLSDLAVICANCHRMIHKSRPWLSLDELENLTYNLRYKK